MVRLPSVSVILATYNSLQFLPRSVRSVLAQAFTDFELIIVDDGSTDDTARFAVSVSASDERVKYLRHSNRRHPLTLNEGLKLAEGRFITFLDADDEYLPGHLEQRVLYLGSNPDCDLIHSPAVIEGDEESAFVPDANDVSKLIHINDCIIGGTLFGRKEVFDSLGGFRNIYSHDSDFVNRASRHFKVSFLDLRTYVYHRDNPGSVTRSIRNERS